MALKSDSVHDLSRIKIFNCNTRLNSQSGKPIRPLKRNLSPALSKQTGRVTEHSWLCAKELLQNVIPPFHATLPVHRTGAINVRPWKSLCWRLFSFSKSRETRSEPLHVTCHYNRLTSVQWIRKQQLRGKYSNHPGREHTQAQVWVVLLHRTVFKPGLVWSKIPYLDTVRQTDPKCCQQFQKSVSNFIPQAQNDKCARISTHAFVVLIDVHKILPR